MEQARPISYNNDFFTDQYAESCAESTGLENNLECYAL